MGSIANFSAVKIKHKGKRPLNRKGLRVTCTQTIWIGVCLLVTPRIKSQRDPAASFYAIPSAGKVFLISDTRELEEGEIPVT